MEDRRKRPVGPKRTKARLLPMLLDRKLNSRTEESQKRESAVKGAFLGEFTSAFNRKFREDGTRSYRILSISDIEDAALCDNKICL
ncbi:hypothetical protein DPMN_059903 [Dreissena polymorpha]|uniref:Uncharacterized protein n=1 Tax=Dreissena polymorpha TaxID=45954 RepID=A0A9D4HFE3_DREPO|nr:hypothetical protein DPMN_059903 [Dreissena polymorpha]